MHFYGHIHAFRLFVSHSIIVQQLPEGELQSRNFPIRCYFLINFAPRRAFASAFTRCYTFIFFFQKQPGNRHRYLFRIIFSSVCAFYSPKWPSLFELAIFLWVKQGRNAAFNSLLSMDAITLRQMDFLEAKVALDCLRSRRDPQ